MMMWARGDPWAPMRMPQRASEPGQVLPQTERHVQANPSDGHCGARPRREPAIHNHRPRSMDSGLASASFRRPGITRLARGDTSAPGVPTKPRQERFPRSNHFIVVVPRQAWAWRRRGLNFIGTRFDMSRPRRGLDPLAVVHYMPSGSRRLEAKLGLRDSPCSARRRATARFVPQ